MFVALRPHPEAVEDLSEFLEPRRGAFDVGWTPPERWHVTLAFVDHVSERALGRFEEALAGVARKRCPLTVRLEGGGVFPDPFAAKVLFAVPAMGDHCRHELGRLASGVRTAATTSGLEIDGARFVPHVTLARSRRPMRAHRFLQVMETYSGPTWRASEIELVASHLGEGRASGRRHEVVASFQLAGVGCEDIEARDPGDPFVERADDEYGGQHPHE
ncbi:2'-5' RNA ligase [Salana multivorans]|uniref:RNA 2',3'-cyclic phosphodiesterase n=2 Tax=Salana multivorans TaxID=120377 RepID=A0A3N2DAD8_9MICO|nr:2'-5' RNA ligase [Salana multivorans]